MFSKNAQFTYSPFEFIFGSSFTYATSYLIAYCCTRCSTVAPFKNGLFPMSNLSSVLFSRLPLPCTMNNLLCSAFPVCSPPSFMRWAAVDSLVQLVHVHCRDDSFKKHNKPTTSALNPLLTVIFFTRQFPSAKWTRS